MITSQSNDEGVSVSQSSSPSAAKIIEYRTVWAPTISEAMTTAQSIKGWKTAGNPGPLAMDGVPGTGVLIIKVLPFVPPKTDLSFLGKDNE